MCQLVNPSDVEGANISTVRELIPLLMLRVEQQLKESRSEFKEAELQMSRGKRLRPRLYLASHFVFATDRDYSKNEKLLVDTASALELLHEASLIHDDILDRAHKRRGKATIREAYGEHVALVLGDFLFAKAIELIFNATSMNSRLFLFMSQKFIYTTSELARGELQQQLERVHNSSSFPTVEEYLRSIRRKTAALFGVSCELGALSAGVSRLQALILWNLGVAFGMAYQIMDDMMDLLPSKDVLEKDIGNDWVSGKMTLPYILGISALQRQGVLERGHCTVGVKEVADILNECGVLERAFEYHRNYYEEAHRQLEKLPRSEGRLILQDILETSQRENYE